VPEEILEVKEEIMAEMAQQNKPVAYVSGPMTGYEDWNFPAFHDVAERLRAAGFAVVNPAENLGGETDMTASWFLGLDITMIVTRCDLMVMLPGWPESDGAKVEALVADAVGLPIYCARENGMVLGNRIHIRDCVVDFAYRSRRAFGEIRDSLARNCNRLEVLA
jgi:hypothetical protein